MSKRQFVVLGLGRFGSSVALTLSEMGYQVLGVDSDEDIVQKLSDKLTHVVAGNIADMTVLKTLGIGNFDVAIISIGDLGDSLMCTMLCKELGVKKVVVKALDDQHGKMAARVGADNVIYSERDMGRRVAHNLVSSNIMDYIELSNDISLMSIKVPKPVRGKSLAESNSRHDYHVNVVAVKSQGKTVVNPLPQTILNAEDEIIVIGEHEAVADLEEDVQN